MILTSKNLAVNMLIMLKSMFTTFYDIIKILRAKCHQKKSTNPTTTVKMKPVSQFENRTTIMDIEEEKANPGQNRMVDEVTVEDYYQMFS